MRQSYHIYRKDTVALVTRNAIPHRELASGVIDSRNIDWVSDSVLAELGPLDENTNKKAAVKLTQVFATNDIADEVRRACPDTPIETLPFLEPDWKVPTWR